MKYMIADSQSESLWGHIFSDDGTEIDCHFVYDREAHEIVAARIEEKGYLRLPTRSQLLDLDDSITNANTDAVDNPAAFGLRTADELPAWTQSN